MNFTTDWFTHRIPIWSQFLLPLKDKELQYLELGTFEGRSLFWMLDNILINTKSFATVIDLWGDLEVKKRFSANLSECGKGLKVNVCHSKVEKLIGDLYHTKKGFYDIIYIDADHSSNSVIRDACMCLEMCKKGGIIIFDDYLWENTNNSPVSMKEAIDCFLLTHKGLVEIIYIGYQVFIRKI